MKFIVSFLLIGLLSLVGCLYLPWWSIAVAAFIVTLVIHQRPLKAFITGFLALLLLWGGLAWWISSNNEHLLAHKVSVVMLKTDSPFILILVTALIGAITAGLAALSASFLRSANHK
ncbi:MAG: hypothetical protein H7Y27_12435 [Gemmatimonadaceae bacterium]|nr:hypothetical protein [Chitinophagaceae bacterium]